MAAIAVAPFAINDATLKLGADTFEAACSKIELTPSYSNTYFDAVDGVSSPVGGAATWSLDLSYAQDPVTAGALASYLRTHDGEKITFEFRPKGGGAGHSGSVLIRAGKSGGTAKQIATADVSMPVFGAPTDLAAA